MVRCNPIDNFFLIIKYTYYRKNSKMTATHTQKQKQNESRTQNHYNNR